MSKLFRRPKKKVYILEDEELTNTNINTLQSVKSEIKHAEDFFTNINADAEASKFIYDKTCLIVCNLIGFIQFIAQNPFGLLFVAGVQVS